MKGTFFGTGGGEAGGYGGEKGWPLQSVEKREEDMLGNKQKDRDKEDLLIEHLGLRTTERRAIKPPGPSGETETRGSFICK